MKDTAYLDAAFDAGNARERELAAITLRKVHECLGMTYDNRRADSTPSPGLGAYA